MIILKTNNSPTNFYNFILFKLKLTLKIRFSKILIGGYSKKSVVRKNIKIILKGGK